MDTLDIFLKGAIAACYAVAGLFFLRFYTRTGDRLFVMFCAALWLLGLVRLVMVVLNVDPQEHHYLYWVRFAAYLLILYAIIEKNLPSRVASKDSLASSPSKPH